MQSKMVFKICEGILCSMLSNLMLLCTKVFSFYNPIKFFVILYTKSLANLVVEVGTRHSHQVRSYYSRSSKATFALFVNFNENNVTLSRSKTDKNTSRLQRDYHVELHVS